MQFGFAWLTKRSSSSLCPPPGCACVPSLGSVLCPLLRGLGVVTRGCCIWSRGSALASRLSPIILVLKKFYTWKTAWIPLAPSPFHTGYDTFFHTSIPGFWLVPFLPCVYFHPPTFQFLPCFWQIGSSLALRPWPVSHAVLPCSQVPRSKSRSCLAFLCSGFVPLPSGGPWK